MATLVLGSLAHVLIWTYSNPEFQGDELRYFEQASSLVAGEPLYADGFISNTPLYPFLLSSLLNAGVASEYLGLSSIVLLLVSTAMLFLMVGRFCTPFWAFIVSSLFILYPPNLMLGSRIMTEPLAIFLALAACWQLIGVNKHSPPNAIRIVSVSFTLMLLALVKPVFGYALIVLIVLALLAGWISKSGLRSTHFRMAVIALLALLFTTPYFLYAQPITGKYFGWVNSGVDHFYWMSIGGEDIWGSWISADKVSNHDALLKNGVAEEVIKAQNMAKADAQLYLSDLAAQNIKQNPQHYVLNMMANAGRLLFNYPFSFRPQSLYTYGYIVPNMILYLSVTLAIALLPITFRYQKPGLIWLMLLGLVFMGGNILVASAARQGMVLFGPILIWLTFQYRILLDLGIITLPQSERTLANRASKPDVP